MTYAEKIAALERINPGHRLLRIFRILQNAGNELLLDRELEKADFPGNAGKSGIPEADDAEILPDEDETLNQLHREQSSLFAERRKISNEFHDCFTDRQRTMVSERIQVVQRQIEMLREKMRAYRQTGRLPEPDERYPVPEDPFRLLALEKSLLASRSRKSREIREIGEEMRQKKAGAEERLEKAEAKMRELETHLTHVRKAIKARNLQPGAISEG